MSAQPHVNQLEGLDRELETILTSFDTHYVWNYGSVKEGLRDLYEKAKREQWNGTTLLAWTTDVDPEGEIFPAITTTNIAKKAAILISHGQLPGVLGSTFFSSSTKFMSFP